jgi:hypothetical protein
MLRGIAYTEEDVGKCLKHSEEGLFGGDVTTLAESEQEMLAFIQSNSRGGVRTTLKALIERFERKPYGWYYALSFVRWRSFVLGVRSRCVAMAIC